MLSGGHASSEAEGSILVDQQKLGEQGMQSILVSKLEVRIFGTPLRVGVHVGQLLLLLSSLTKLGAIEFLPSGSQSQGQALYFADLHFPKTWGNGNSEICQH